MARDFESVEQLLRVQTPTKISVGGKVLESTCGFWWVTSEESLQSTTLSAGAPVEVPEWQHAQLRLDVIGQSSLKEYSDGNTVTYFDAAEIDHPIKVRGFNPGDRFQPFGLSGSQKLKKLFIDRKIPAPLRLHWPIIECNGKILWVVGLRRSDYAPISNTTTEVIRLELIGRVPCHPTRLTCRTFSPLEGGSREAISKSLVMELCSSSCFSSATASLRPATARLPM